MTITISIEGNIGVGKSSFIDILKKNFDCEVVPEPVQMWLNIKDTNNKNILQTFYDDITRWGYTFQNVACITRMMSIEETIRNTNKEFVFLDRSLGTDKNVFELMLYNNGNINSLEHNIYNLWIDFYTKYVRKNVMNKIIYLQASPEVCKERIKLRGRQEEANIDINYLVNLHNYHENWLNNDSDNVLILDCNTDFINDIDYRTKLIQIVKNFIY